MIFARRPTLVGFRRHTGLLAAMPLLASCGPQEQPAPDRQPGASTISEVRGRTLGHVSLHGTWDIVSIDGAAPIMPATGPAPHLRFDAAGYGGTTGCNHFGGLGLPEAGRYYSVPGPQTAMACGRLSAQEDAVTRLLALSPVMTLAPDGTLELAADGRTLVLRRSAAPRPEPAAAAP